MLDAMTEITLHTASRTFTLRNDEAMDLVAHIRQAGGPHRHDVEQPILDAIDDPDARDVRWSDDAKRAALHAIDVWLISEGTPAVPDVISDLRYELMRDLGLPPFDEEIPYDPT